MAATIFAAIDGMKGTKRFRSGAWRLKVYDRSIDSMLAVTVRSMIASIDSSIPGKHSCLP